MNITMRLRQMGLTVEQYHARVRPFTRNNLITLIK